jgi:hypothetical protein
MSFVDRVKARTGSVLSIGKRQGKRAQLEVQNRQVERKINKEYARIGRTLYPLLRGGELATNNAEVAAAVAAVTEMQADVERRQGEIDEVIRPPANDAIESPAEVEQQAES